VGENSSSKMDLEALLVCLYAHYQRPK
jgi:hypothetical protein